MDTMLNGVDFAVIYLDDILLISEDPEEHKKMVFRSIQDYGFKLKNKNTNSLLINSNIWNK